MIGLLMMMIWLIRVVFLNGCLDFDEELIVVEFDVNLEYLLYILLLIVCYRYI